MKPSIKPKNELFDFLAIVGIFIACMVIYTSTARAGDPDGMIEYHDYSAYRAAVNAYVECGNNSVSGGLCRRPRYVPCERFSVSGRVCDKVIPESCAIVDMDRQELHILGAQTLRGRVFPYAKFYWDATGFHLIELDE